MSDKEDRSGGPQTSGDLPMPNLKRRGLKGFYRDVIREMRHVTWPSRAETNRLTGVVLAVCLLVIVILTALSLVFEQLFEAILRS